MISWFRRKVILPEGMADLHNHVLPGLDDGAVDREMTITMLNSFVELGFSAIVSTSHLRHPLFPKVDATQILGKVAEVQRWVAEEEIPLKVYPGAEVYYNDDIFDLWEQGSLVPLGMSSQFLLIEFSPKDPLLRMRELAFELTTRGVQPILAHPERYLALQRKPALAEDWCRAGWSLQLDLPSLDKRGDTETRRLAERLVKERRFDLAASDLHAPPTPADQLKTQLEALARLAGSDEMQRLMVVNPHRLLEGKFPREAD